MCVSPKATPSTATAFVEAELMGDDDVGVALHHQGRLLLALVDRFLGQVEAVEQVALAEQRRFGRVDVLGRAVDLDARQQPPADADRPALGIANCETTRARGSRSYGLPPCEERANTPIVSRTLPATALPPACLRIQSRSSGAKPSWKRSMLSSLMPRS